MAPISKLFLPPAALSGCVLAGVYRDTRGAQLSAADRTNHFPASPLVSVTFVLEGALHLIPPGKDWRAAQATPALPEQFVMGPQDGPVSSWAAGEVVALSVGVYPDAWWALGGDESRSAVPAVFGAAFAQFCSAPDPDAGWDLFAAELGRPWAQGRADLGHRAGSVSDWVRALATRAALSGSGRSLRSMERRIKRYSGQTRRSLEFFGAFERLQGHARANADASLADVALAAGYADQSHMGRAVRRATGFSPARLNRAIAQEEAFWCYRLLGERF